MLCLYYILYSTAGDWNSLKAGNLPKLMIQGTGVDRVRRILKSS